MIDRRVLGLAALFLWGCASGPATTGERAVARDQPISLDATDPRYAAYLTLVRDRIKAHWLYPCVKSSVTGECEYKAVDLVVDFGILKAGRVQFVEILKSSGVAVYDEAAVNAIRQASPFPEVPDALMARMSAGSTGVALRGRFRYVVAPPTRDPPQIFRR